MHPGQNGSQDWVSRPVLYPGGALSLAQESPECDVRNGWFNSHRLQCPRLQCKFPAKLETRNVSVSFPSLRTKCVSWSLVWWYWSILTHRQNCLSRKNPSTPTAAITSPPLHLPILDKANNLSTSSFKNGIETITKRCNRAFYNPGSLWVIQDYACQPRQWDFIKGLRQGIHSAHFCWT